MGHRRFPLFVDLTGRRAVVVGGGPVGLGRAAARARFGAAVTVIAPALAGPVGEGAAPAARPTRPGDLAVSYTQMTLPTTPYV